MSSRIFLTIFLLVTPVCGKYLRLEAHGEVVQNVARQVLDAFSLEQGIDVGRLRLLDVLEAKHQVVYSPQDAYKLGDLYALRVAIGIGECRITKKCPTIQGFLVDATVLSVVNKETEFSLRVLSNKLH